MVVNYKLGARQKMVSFLVRKNSSPVADNWNIARQKFS